MLFSSLLYDVPQFVCPFKLFPEGFSRWRFPTQLQALPLLAISEKVALHALAPLLATDAVTPHSTLASPVVAHGRGKGCWWDPALVVGRHHVLCPRRGAFLVILRCSQLWETFHRFSPGWVSASSSEAEIFFFYSLPPVAMGALKTIEFSVLPPGA